MTNPQGGASLRAGWLLCTLGQFAGFYPSFHSTDRSNTQAPGRHSVVTWSDKQRYTRAMNLPTG